MHVCICHTYAGKNLHGNCEDSASLYTIFNYLHLHKLYTFMDVTFSLFLIIIIRLFIFAMYEKKKINKNFILKISFIYISLLGIEWLEASNCIAYVDYYFMLNLNTNYLYETYCHFILICLEYLLNVYTYICTYIYTYMLYIQTTNSLSSLKVIVV